MTKAVNYILTVTDMNDIAPPSGAAVPDSNRCVVKDESGTTGSPGTVGASNHWDIDTGASPYVTYTNNRLPRFQDIVVGAYNCGDGWIYGSYQGEDLYVYNDYAITSTTTTSVSFSWESLDRPNIFSVYDSTGIRYTTGWVGYATYAGPWGASLNTATTGTVTVTFASTTGRYVQVTAGPADPSAPLTDVFEWLMNCITTTTTTSTSTSTTTTTTTLPPYVAYDLYYPCGSTTPATQRLQYGGSTPALDPGAIIQASNGLCYTVVGPTTSGPYNVTYVAEYSTCNDCCNPTPDWENNGATFCSGCNLYQPQIDVNPCSPTYNNTRNVDLGANDSCGTWVFSYYCSGCDKYSHEVNSCTSNVRNVTLVETNSTYCGGCCGQSTAPNWTYESYTCTSGEQINTERDTNACSPTYNQTRQVNIGYTTACCSYWSLSVSYNSQYCAGTSSTCLAVVTLNASAVGGAEVRLVAVGGGTTTGWTAMTSPTTTISGVCAGFYRAEIRSAVYNPCVVSSSNFTVNECYVPTTTTTTTASPYYYYNAYRFECNLPAGPCLAAGEVIIRSPSALSNGSWYSDGSYAYQPYSTTVNTSYSWDADGYLYTQASTCSIACINY